MLVSAQLRAKEHDRTKYYRVDYKVLDSILPDQVVSREPDEVASKPPSKAASNAPGQAASIYRTETPTENTAKREKRPPRAQSTQKKNYRPDEYSDIILG